MLNTSDWWRRDFALSRFISDLIAFELSRSSPDRPAPKRPWPLSLPLGSDGLGADSLELLTLAAALGQALHLHRSGIEDYLLVRRTLGDWIAIAETSLARYSREVTFQTSGSTGTPKSCVHAMADLEQEVECLAALFADRRRIIAAVPSHHIYGFIFTQLLSARLDVPVIEFTTRSTVGLVAELRPGDLVVGHPEFWRVASRSTPTFLPDVIGVTSTAPCPSHLPAHLIASGLRQFVEIYGSSETGGIGWRVDPVDNYTLFEFWQRDASDFGLVRRRGDESVTTVEIQDTLLWSDERRFTVAGRRDGAVQVGGMNVYPGRVEDVLAQHPKVALARVRLMRVDEGTRMKAFVVPRTLEADQAELREELFRWAETRLTTPEQPKAISFGPALPVGPLGKPVDWDLDAP